MGDTAWGSDQQFELATGVSMTYGDVVALGTTTSRLTG